MTLLDHKERIERGSEQQANLCGKPAQKPKTLFQSSWRDYIYSEIWTRPDLDLRARYLISVASAAGNDTPEDILDNYVRGSLVQEQLSVTELREAALHLAIYSGWSRGAVMDASIDRIVAELGLTEPDFEPLRNAPWDPEVRLKEGGEGFHKVMTFGGPPPVSPYYEAGILNYVFGEVWNRPGLDERSRRWVTLVGVADSSAESPIKTHIYGAMASGNASATEMQEFVLQYAVHSGWPKASYVQGVVFDMANKVKNNLSWDGTPL